MFDEQAINEFFLEGVPAALHKLAVDTLPLWGTMNCKQMLVHLKQSTEMIHFQGELNMRIPEEKIERAIAFLYSDKAIQKGVQVPLDIGYDLSDGSKEEMEQLKADLVIAIKKMLHYFQENPKHQSVHPYFGTLNVEQWLLFQRKHFQHHLRQFGVI